MFSQIKKHYHWIIALLMFLQLAAVGGLGNNYSGLFILHITEDLGISRASFSIAFTLKYLTGFLTTLFSGVLFLRFGNKTPMIAGLLLCGAGYAIMPLSTNILPLAIGNILLGIGDALCCTAAVSRIISAWFHRYQGLVWGAVSASTGIGGSVICVLLSGIIQSHGWRIAYFASAIIIGITFLLVFILVKGRPEQMELSPYGFGMATAQKRPAKDPQWAGYPMEDLIRAPIFYLTLASVFLSSSAIYLAYDIIVPHLQDSGLTQDQAVAQQSAMLIYLTASKFLSGALSDRIGSKTVTISCAAIGGASLWLLSGVTSPASATMAIIFYAIALPLPTVLIPLLTQNFFGYRAHSMYLGIFMSIPQLALLIAAPASNTIFDTTGSYTLALQIAAALAAAGTVLLIVTSILSHHAKKQMASK